MKLSVIHPTCRPEKALANLQRWRERCLDWSQVEYIVIGDTNASANIIGDLHLAATKCEFLEPRPGYVYKLNRGGQLATGDVIIETHDDICPPESWDLLIAGEMSGAGERVLRVTHGGNRERELCVPMILSRGWYERWKFVSHPALVHLFADDYFTWLAEKHGVIRDAFGIDFKHEHPYFMPEDERAAAMDETYQANYSEGRWSEDGHTFEMLKYAWEPVPENETVQIHIPVANRHDLARECVKLLRARSTENAQIIVWLDGVTAQHQTENWEGATKVFSTPRMGVELQRALHLKFWEKHPTPWLYFTDGDAVHATGWFQSLRKLAIETGDLISGYRTGAHANDAATGQTGAGNGNRNEAGEFEELPSVHESSPCFNE